MADIDTILAELRAMRGENADAHQAVIEAVDKQIAAQSKRIDSLDETVSGDGGLVIRTALVEQTQQTMVKVLWGGFVGIVGLFGDMVRDHLISWFRPH